MGSAIKGSDLYLSKKKGSDGITSCFVATRTNLILSCSLAHAEGEIVYIGSELVLLSGR